ncbi:MAG TPA: cysteine peptidase family C39 domain-containing protein, partial [Thermoanaerobaculia bacterium]
MNRLRALGLALLCAAPACYTGSARDVSPQWLERASRDGSWEIVSGVPFVAQNSTDDCGSAALAMVLAHFGVSASIDQV